MVVTVIGWYWDGVDNLGEMIYQQVMREAARKRGVELQFTDDPSKIDGPAIIGGGDVVNGYWLQTLASVSGKERMSRLTKADDDVLSFRFSHHSHMERYFRFPSKFGPHSSLKGSVLSSGVLTNQVT